MTTRLLLTITGALVWTTLSACSASSTDRSNAGGGAGGGSSGASAGGASGASGSNAAGSSGTAGFSGAAGSSGAGGAAGSAGSSGASGSAGAGGGGVVASCTDAQRAYTLTSNELGASYVSYVTTSGWGSDLFPQVPVAVAEDGAVFIGFTQDNGGARSAMIVGEPGSTFAPITIPDAVVGGIAATSDGVAVLLFDPADVGDRTWAQVRRFGRDGTERFATDLFRSPNLDDMGTRGEPGTSRLGYIGATDELIVYLGHTRRSSDGVRHQGGYVASISASGEQAVLDDWFASHNLDQRILVDGSRAALLGLGDAFPKGILFSFTDAELDTNVIYLVAADGSGSANGQLGGMVDLGADIAVPFITNLTISQELDPGPWPNQDPAIQDQIQAAADNGRDVGLLYLPKQGAIPDAAGVEPLWVETARGSDLGDTARLEGLKSARYGDAELIFLGWIEATGGSRDETTAHYTMVVDRAGAVCQPKTRLPDEASFTSDDVVRHPDGSIVWASRQDGAVRLVKLLP